MNGANAEALWMRLKAAGLVADTPAPATVAPTPWSARVMSGVGGWIGALFLLPFLAVVFEPLMHSPHALAGVGLAGCAAAVGLFRSKPDSEFASQFALALSFAGQGVVIFALFDAWRNLTAIALGTVVLESVLFFTIPNFVHRLWSTWAALYAAMIALAEWQLQPYTSGLLAIAFAWIWLNEFQQVRYAPLVRPAGYAVALSLLLLTSPQGMVGIDSWRGAGVPPFGYHLLLGSLLTGGVFVGAIWRLLRRARVAAGSSHGRASLIAAVLLALASLKAAGLAPATLVLLLGKANGSRLLLGLGAAALLADLGLYYYSLEMTLLQKSALMVTTGVALLAARHALRRSRPVTAPEVSDA